MKFKNISCKNLIVPGIGMVKSGKTVDLPSEFHNANFIEVKRMEPIKPIKITKKYNKKQK
jgi:hypothetical protein